MTLSRRVFSLHLLSLGLVLGLACGCSSSSPDPADPNMGLMANSTAFHKPPKPLVPRGIRLYTGKNAPIVNYVAPGKAAARAGIMLRDQLLSLNGHRVYTATEFEEQIHLAPRYSTILFKRGDLLKQVKVTLASMRPRLGASFEPMGVPLINSTEPLVAYMHLNDLTVFAETSFNDRKKEIHLNLIMRSMKPVALARLTYLVTEKGRTAPLARGVEEIDALGSDSRIISRVIPDSDKLKGPLQVSVNIDRNHFHFEFQ